MKTLLLILTFLLPAIGSAAETIQSLTSRLEDVLSHRSEYVEHKEQRIDSLSVALSHTSNTEQKFALYGQLFNEFLTYKADSVINCVNREMQFATANHEPNHIAAAKIHHVHALATTGYFSHAINTLEEIDASALPDSIKADYYKAKEWVYGAWAEYANDATYAPAYQQIRLACLDSIIAVLPQESAQWKYAEAERHLRLHQYDKALPIYEEILAENPENSRLYAQAAYAEAMIYADKKDWDNYERYLLRAAISDQVTPLKENLALQQLALFINEHHGDIERANRYLLYSLEDANFYNNRLRLLEIARKFPTVIGSYQANMARKNSTQNIALWIIAALCLVILCALFMIYHQWKRARRRSADIANANSQLALLNARLIGTNEMREQYVCLFMDLCATYIDKYNKYRSLVRNKVKARQYDDLLKPALYRSTETESREMFFNFDKAFLQIFPDFVVQFNRLLREDQQIELKPNEQLNTELRIFAMIRMGITDSAKIATLLFYSPQTIYNYRTAIRNRAIDRKNFEAEVAQLCQLNESK